MFNCTGCGKTKVGIKEYRHTSKIREVEYLVQIQYDRVSTIEGVTQTKQTYKTIKRTHGSEIVEEKSYCKKCLPANKKPEVVESVKRPLIIAKKKLKNYDKEAKGDKNGKKKTRNKTNRRPSEQNA